MKSRLFSAVDDLLRTRVSKILAEKSGGTQKKKENYISGCLLIFDYPFRAYLFFFFTRKINDPLDASLYRFLQLSGRNRLYREKQSGWPLSAEGASIQERVEI